MTKEELVAKINKGEWKEADLWGANLGGADLRGAKYSIPILLHSVNWDELSDKLTLELMRHDALLVGNKAMNEWAKDGNCPFVKTIRGFYFNEKGKLWKLGKPKMNEMELWIALCKEKNIRI